MDGKNEKNGPGQPEKPGVVDKYLLRFRANYPDLQESLKNMAKNSGNSLNAYLLKILDDHVKVHNPLSKKETFILEENFISFFQNIALKINSIEGDLQSIKHTKTQSLKDFIEITYPNPLERKVIYLKLINNYINAERELLSCILMIDTLDQDKKTSKIYNYIDFYCEEYNLDPNTNREKVILKITNNFYQKWYLQLDLYNIFNDKSRFNINIKALERFLFTKLFTNLKSIPLFKKEKYNNLKKKWKKVINFYPNNEFTYPKTFTLNNIEKYLDFLKGLKKHLEFCYGLDVFDNEKLKIETVNKLKNLMDLDRYEYLINTIKMTSNLKKEYDNAMCSHLLNNFSYTISPQENDFFSCITYCFDQLVYGDIPIFKNSYYSLLKYLRKNLEINTYIFNTYVIQDLLKLTDFYDYLKKKQGIQNFLQALFESLGL